jgi:hypothetical protein
VPGVSHSSRCSLPGTVGPATRSPATLLCYRYAEGAEGTARVGGGAAATPPSAGGARALPLRRAEGEGAARKRGCRAVTPALSPFAALLALPVPRSRLKRARARRQLRHPFRTIAKQQYLVAEPVRSISSFDSYFFLKYKSYILFYD